MKYSINDKIIVLHSDEEGKVIEIINEKMVMIEVRGVKFPAYTDQIDFPYFKMFTKKKEPVKQKIFVDNIKKEKTTVRKKIKDGVFLMFYPVFDQDVFGDEVVSKLKIYFINHNEEDYRFKYSVRLANRIDFELENLLYGLSDFYIHDLAFEELSDNPDFSFEFSLAKPFKNKAPYYERELKLRGKQIFKKIEEIKEKNEPSFSWELFLHYPDKQEEPKMDLSKLTGAGFRMHTDGKVAESKNLARSVVDLHIDKLTDFHHQLSNPEILSTQISVFEKYLDEAIAYGQPKIIFIHGVGEGTLKNILHEKLKHHALVSSFINRYHPDFGYGATEVFLK